MLFTTIFRSFDYQTQAVHIWGDFAVVSLAIFGTMFASMVVLGICLNRGKLKDYFEILRHPGTLATDFVVLGGFGNTIMNMGVVGLMGLAYILMINGDFNGPTLGGLLTMVGFAAFGKHPKKLFPYYVRSIFCMFNAKTSAK